MSSFLDAIISYFPFSPFNPHLPLFPLTDSPTLTSLTSKNQCYGHLSRGWGWGEGQQVEHKHTCLPHPLYLPSWGCQAEGPINRPSEPYNHHCQAQVPVEHGGLTLQTVCGEAGQAGWLMPRLLLEGSTEHVKPQPVSPGALHGWKGLTLSGTGGRIDPRPSHERPPHINDSEEGALFSVFKL